MRAEEILRHIDARIFAGDAADILLREDGRDGFALRGGVLRLACPDAHFPELAEDSLDDHLGNLLRHAAAFVCLQNDCIRSGVAERARQRRGEGALVRIDPDELGTQGADAGNQLVGVLRADANLVKLALVARAGVDIQNEIRAGHILNNLPAQVFKRCTVRRTGKSAVHIQPRSGGNHAVGNIQTERVEHRIEIHHAVECIRVGGYALFNAVDDELTHHFVAMRAGCDTDTSGGCALRGIAAAFDAPSFFNGQRDVRDCRHLFMQSDSSLSLASCIGRMLFCINSKHTRPFPAMMLSQTEVFCK